LNRNRKWNWIKLENEIEIETKTERNCKEKKINTKWVFLERERTESQKQRIKNCMLLCSPPFCNRQLDLNKCSILNLMAQIFSILIQRIKTENKIWK